MNRNKIGRNAPCLCGSGKKYKHCCGRPGTSRGTGTTDALKKALEEQNFATLEEAQSFTASYMERANTTGIDDFDGLSPEQMSALLYAPMDSPRTLSFAQSGVAATRAPIMIVFNAMADAMGEDGLKATAKGNLPRALCQSAHSIYPGVVADDPTAGLISVNREDDFAALHIARIVGEMAGLIRKFKGRFRLTRKGERLRKQDGIYPVLLATLAQKFNWPYSDGYPDLPLLQQAFAFTLYLIHRHGAKQHREKFYEDAFIRAFPMVLDSVEPSPYQDSETIVRRCYTLRTLVRFAGFLGLVDITQTKMDVLDPRLQITKTPLFEKAVQFVLN